MADAPPRQVRRDWIKVHAMIDVETNQVLSLEITDSSVPDDPMVVLLLDQTPQYCDEEHWRWGLRPKLALQRPRTTVDPIFRSKTITS